MNKIKAIMHNKVLYQLNNEEKPKIDYIIVDEDGTKHVCGADKIWKRYERIEE